MKKLNSQSVAKSDKAKSASAKKAQEKSALKNDVLTIGAVFGKFPKIPCDRMKVDDRASYSAVVGMLAKDNNACIDLPLALNAQGKELFTIQKITRVIYAVSQFYSNKIELSIKSQVGLEGDTFYLLTIARVQNEVKLPTRQADAKEVKLESSKKRKERASANKAQKESAQALTVEKKAQATIKALTNIVDDKLNDLQKIDDEHARALKTGDDSKIKRLETEKRAVKDTRFIASVQAVIIHYLPDVDLNTSDKIARSILVNVNKYWK